MMLRDPNVIDPEGVLEMQAREDEWLLEQDRVDRQKEKGCWRDEAADAIREGSR